MAALGTALWVVWSAPVLLAEVLVDGLVLTGLYRRLRRGPEPTYWLAGAVRRTWLPALVAAVLFSGAGWLLHKAAPEARSIGFGVLLAVAVARIFGLPFGASASIVLGVMWLIAFAAFAVRCCYAKSAAGALLLDCGRHPAGDLFLASAIFFLAMGGTGQFDNLDGRLNFRFAGALFGVAIFLSHCHLFFGRLQIRENGILGGFIKDGFPGVANMQPELAYPWG